jgi:rhodanese-related sulfurtransferase
MKLCPSFATIIFLALPSLLSAQDLQLQFASREGLLAWTNSSLCVTCRVEWAAQVDGPWRADWDSLTHIVMTNHVAERPVPRFFRVLCMPARAQWVTNISAQAAFTLITNRWGDPQFKILDVRAPSEYASRHIKGALNLNLNSPTFSSDVARLSRCGAFVVYCASGNRSRQAAAQMQALGFLEVYDLGALGAFTALPGSAAWLEP